MNLRKIANRSVIALVLMTSTAFASSFDQFRREIESLDRSTSSERSGGHEHRAQKLNPSDALALYTPAQAKTGLDACANQFPSGRPLSLRLFNANMKPLGLCSDGFGVIYSPQSKTPLVVTERLNAARVQDAAGEERTDNFYPDPRLPEGSRAELSDYQHSGYDRGHNSPAADAWDQHTMSQTFALSNMFPQNPTNNRKPWAGIEKATRKFASRASGDVFVFTGPIFSGQISTIGRNQVWVPSYLFKLVYDQSGQRAWAYILPNSAEAQVTAPMDYATFVKTTGLDLLAGQPVSGSIR